MLTIMIHATIKEEYLDEYIELASFLTRETRNKTEGCISYAFNQRQDKPTEFVIFEQWENQEALDEHIRHLVTLLGPPRDGDSLPEKLITMYDSGIPYYYTVIE